MANPPSLQNDLSQSIDTAYDVSGDGFLPLAVDDVAVAGVTPHASRRGVATHKDGVTFSSGDGVVVGAGVDPDDQVVHPLKVAADGALAIDVGPAQGVMTDRSGALTVGATVQMLMDVNTSRKYLFIQNVSTTEEMWIDFTTDAVLDKPSVRIDPLGTFELGAGFVTTEKITVIATTIGHKYTAKEGQ